MKTLPLEMKFDGLQIWEVEQVKEPTLGRSRWNLKISLQEPNFHGCCVESRRNMGNSTERERERLTEKNR